MTLTFYWHDYETWGADPSRDRAAQFAGVRTDAALNAVGKPLALYCKPADDMLPQPGACLVTGITPAQARAEGVNEAEFFQRIHQELALPGSCGVGYNSIRFDDEVTRYGFYRNFFDPYAREWQNGNSRWDIIDLVRLTHALRPEGLVWPEHEDGSPSFRLEQLTEANGIAHQGAHDALADVYATIDLARLIRRRQPRLFDYLLRMRSKQRLRELLDMGAGKPVLHVSSMYPASRGCIAMVVALARHPVNKNGVIVYDLRYDPGPLLSLAPEQIAERLFTARDQLPAGEQRIPLKTVHLNKCPVVVPMNTLTQQAAERWDIDQTAGRAHLQQLNAAAGLEKKIQSVFAARQFESETDPDRNLYGGGFFGDADKRRMQQIRAADPQRLGQVPATFDDVRLPEMLFRYRARNWPTTLTQDERQRWDAYRCERLTRQGAGSSITLDEYRGQLARMMVDPALGERQRAILSELADWPAAIGIASM